MNKIKYLLFIGIILNSLAMENPEKQLQKLNERYYQFVSEDGTNFTLAPSICNQSSVLAAMFSKEQSNEPKKLEFNNSTLMSFFELLVFIKSVQEQNLIKEKIIEQIIEKMKTTNDIDKKILNVLNAAETFQVPEIKAACIKHLITLLKNDDIESFNIQTEKNKYLIKGLQTLFHGKKIEYNPEIITELTSQIDSLPGWNDEKTSKQQLAICLLKGMKSSSNNPSGFKSLDMQIFENFKNEFTEEEKINILKHLKSRK